MKKTLPFCQFVFLVCALSCTEHKPSLVAEWRFYEDSLSLDNNIINITDSLDIVHGYPGAISVSDSTIMMYDHSLSQLRLMDLQWNTTHIIQKPGSGPCEFRSIVYAERRGDLVIVNDFPGFKIIIYDLNSEDLNACKEIMYDTKASRILEVISYNHDTETIDVFAGEREGSTISVMRLGEGITEELTSIDIPEFRDDPNRHPVALLFNIFKQNDVIHLFPTYYAGWSLRYEPEKRAFTRVQHHSGAGPGYEYSTTTQPQDGPLYVRSRTNDHDQYWLSINHGYGVISDSTEFYYMYRNQSKDHCLYERCIFADVFNINGDYRYTAQLFAGSLAELPNLPDVMAAVRKDGRFIGYNYTDGAVLKEGRIRRYY